MGKLKGISVFMAITMILSSMPYDVLAVTDHTVDIPQSIESVINEETLDTDEELEDTTEELPDTSEVNTEVEVPEIEMGPMPVFFNTRLDTSIHILDGERLVLNNDGKYIITTGSTSGINWALVNDTYDHNTLVTFDHNASIETVTTVANPIRINKIESASNGHLTIVAGSHVNIQSAADDGIKVDKLTIGDGLGSGVRTTVNITTDKIGVIANDINIYDTDLDIKSGNMGIACIDQYTPSPTDGNLTTTDSNLTVRTKQAGIPAVNLLQLTLNGGKIDAVSEAGTGIVAHSIVVWDKAVLNAKSESGSNEKGIVTIVLHNDGSVTGTAVEGNCGILVDTNLHMQSTSQVGSPSLLGQAKTGTGILLGSTNHVINLGMDTGSVIGKVEDGIGIQCKDIDLGMAGLPSATRELIGIAEKGYGIVAQNIRIVSNNWSVHGEAKGVSNSTWGLPVWVPSAAGIILTDTKASNDESVLMATGGDVTIEGVAPTDVIGSCGIYIFPDPNSSLNSTGQLRFTSSEKISVNAVGDIAIWAQRVYLQEVPGGNPDGQLFITANGTTTGMKMEYLYMNGIGPEANPADYRIKATGKNGVGIEIRPQFTSSLTLFGASIEATGKLYGIYVDETDFVDFENTAIKATATGQNSIAGIYMDAGAAQMPASPLGALSVGESRIIAESENYGWHSRNYIVTVRPLFFTGQLIPTYIEAIGAEVGMKVSFDQANYSVSGPLVELHGEETRDSVIVKAIAKSTPPDGATRSAFDYEKVPSSNPSNTDGIIQVDCATLIEEYQTKAQWPVKTVPSWPYAKNLNLGKILNYDWVFTPASSGILVAKAQNGITCTQGSGDLNVEITRNGRNNITPEPDEPIVLSSVVMNGLMLEHEDATHKILLKATFDSNTGGSGGNGGGGGGTTSTEPENPSTGASTSIEPATTSETDPEIMPPGGVDGEYNKPGTTTGDTNISTNPEKENLGKGTGIKPPVKWNHGRPNTGDMSGQYVLLAFVLLSAMSGGYIVMLHRKKNRL